MTELWDVWVKAKYGTELFAKNKNAGERYFYELIQEYNRYEAIIFYQWALACEKIGEETLATEKFRIAYNGLFHDFPEADFTKLKFYFFTDDDIKHTDEYWLFFNLFKSSYVGIPYGGYYSVRYRVPIQCDLWLKIAIEKLAWDKHSFRDLKNILKHETDLGFFKKGDGLNWALTEAIFETTDGRRNEDLSCFEKAMKAFSCPSYIGMAIGNISESLFHLAILIKAYSDVGPYYSKRYENNNKIERLAIAIEFVLWEDCFLKVDTVKMSVKNIIENEDINTNGVSICDICNAMENVVVENVAWVVSGFELSGEYGTENYTATYEIWNPLEEEGMPI